MLITNYKNEELLFPLRNPDLGVKKPLTEASGEGASGNLFVGDAAAGFLSILRGAENCPINIWAELFARHISIGEPFNCWAMFGWNLSTLQLPLTNSAFGHPNKIGNGLQRANF